MLEDDVTVSIATGRVLTVISDFGGEKNGKEGSGAGDQAPERER